MAKEDRDAARYKRAKTDLKAAAADTSEKDIREHTEKGAEFKKALGEFWRSGVEPKGSKGPDH